MQAGESPDVSVPLAHYLRFQPDRAARAQPVVLVDSDHGPARARGDGGAGARVARADLPGNGARGLARRAIARLTAAERGHARRPDARRRPGRARARTMCGGSSRRSLRMLMGLVGLVLVCRVRQRREPAARARRRAAPRDRSAPRARRQPRPDRASAPGRIPVARVCRRGARHRARVVGPRSAAGAAAVRQHASVVLDLPLDARVLGFTIARRRRDGAALRSRAGAPRHARRPDGAVPGRRADARQAAAARGSARR